MKKPNIVFVLTDDQGYGDLACMGNPYIKTPNIDNFYNESVRLTDYHVGPTCAPTRAGIMTGHYANSTGVWHTVGGRSLLRENEWTLASAFSEGGYNTAIFGKWHLGDNYPYRAMDRGFGRSIVHGGGGITQAPDFWGNDYFDDTYYVDGVPKKFNGYCTDVFFGEAMKYIEEKKNEPFFCMITLNAPHSPHNVPKKYYDMYKENENIPDARSRMYGMVTNIDENFGKLKNHLETLGLIDDTIFIFMTDNGTAVGVDLDENDFVTHGYNCGMRGKKNSEYDGGHRVPFFISCPSLGIGGGKDMNELCANVDLMPTFMELCGVANTKNIKFDGISIAEQLKDCNKKTVDRIIVTDSQRVTNPIKWKKSAVMWQNYRLINGKELYNIDADREQRNDIAANFPDIVEKMRIGYDDWWEKVTKGYEIEIPIYLTEEEVYLSSHDLRGDVSDCVYSQELIRRADIGHSYWEVYVPVAGSYTFDVRRWPKSHPKALCAGITDGTSDVEYNANEVEEAASYLGGVAIDIVKTTLTIGGETYEQTVCEKTLGSVFTVELKEGPAHLYAFFLDSKSIERSAYFVYVTKTNET